MYKFSQSQSIEKMDVLFLKKKKMVEFSDELIIIKISVMDYSLLYFQINN